MRWSNIRDEELPSLEGMTLAGREMVMGAPVHGTDTKVGLQIIEACRDNRYLSDYKLTKVDLANLSKIIVYLDNEFQVILDREHIEHKLKMLGIVLSQHKIDFKEARYIDLRFNQPVVGRK
jgi:hypothetical protein